MFVPRNEFPSSNAYSQEWKTTILRVSLAIFGLLAWCAAGEYLLP